MAEPPPDLAAAYDAHASALYAFLLSMTRSQADARDLLQEVFIKLARNPGLLAAARDPRGFLIHLSHNLLIDLRRRQAGRERRDEAAGMDSVALFEQGPHPDEAAFREALAAALGVLPAEQREVVHLKLWEGLTFEQIATALRIPANTAASRYRYGIDKLRDQLRPLYEEIR